MSETTATLEYPDSLTHLAAELNTLCSEYGVPPAVSTSRGSESAYTVCSNALLDLYSALFSPDVALPRAIQDTVTARVKSIKLLIGTIANDVLKMDLSYIDPLAVAAGDEDAVRELLQVVVALGRIVRKKQRRALELNEARFSTMEDESDDSVEPVSEYSDDPDSDFDLASDVSTKSRSRSKDRTITMINNAGIPHRRRQSDQERLKSMSDRHSTKRFRDSPQSPPFERGRSLSLLPLHKPRRRTRSFPGYATAKSLRASYSSNRISKSFPIPVRRRLQSYTRRSLQPPLRSPIRALSAGLPIRPQSAPGSKNRRIAKSGMTPEQPWTQGILHDDWTTDDDKASQMRDDSDIELSETSNEPVRILPFYLANHGSATSLSASQRTSYERLARFNTRENKRDADLLNQPYHRQNGTLSYTDLSPSVIDRNERFVSPKKRSKLLHLRIDPYSSSDGDLDDSDDGDNSSTAAKFDESTKRMARLEESRRSQARHERELRRKFMGLSVY